MAGPFLGCGNRYQGLHDRRFEGDGYRGPLPAENGLQYLLPAVAEDHGRAGGNEQTLRAAALAYAPSADLGLSTSSSSTSTKGYGRGGAAERGRAALPKAAAEPAAGRDLLGDNWSLVSSSDASC